MLVLTRRRAESIKIGDGIVIKVIQTGRGMVRLGIEAPANVKVLRGELTEFAEQPVGVSDAPTDALDIETEGEVVSEQSADDETRIDFTTEYAMELEEQIECASSSC